MVRHCSSIVPTDLAANRFIREVYLPEHNALFTRSPEIAGSAFVAADAALLAEILCVEEERVVGRDNTVAYDGLKLQPPPSPLRPHDVKARVKVRCYPNGALAVFHGPRCLARYDAEGELIDPCATKTGHLCVLPTSRRPS